jgi:hypothetical protein
MQANISQADTSETEFTAEEKQGIERMRRLIETALVSVGIKPDVSLARFDSAKKTFAEKLLALEDISKFVVSQKKKAVQKGFSLSGWDADETRRYLSEFGCEKLDSATPLQIEAIWQDMKTARMIF